VQQVLPGAAMAAVLVVDYLTWRNTSLLPLFSVGPALAAASGTRRRVVLTGAAASYAAAARQRIESGGPWNGAPTASGSSPA
jgi:hypothetical protein